jgi:hypothetical protein
VGIKSHFSAKKYNIIKTVVQLEVLHNPKPLIPLPLGKIDKGKEFFFK